MGQFFGIPEWMALTLWLSFFICLYFGIAFYLAGRARKMLAAKRPDPSREEFLRVMMTDVSEATAAWMWDKLQFYYRPLTPHPGDLLTEDACIDSDDVAMDWPADYARHRGKGEIDWPQWPDGWPLTVLNYARWLEMGVVR